MDGTISYTWMVWDWWFTWKKTLSILETNMEKYGKHLASPSLHVLLSTPIFHVFPHIALPKQLDHWAEFTCI